MAARSAMAAACQPARTREKKITLAHEAPSVSTKARIAVCHFTLGLITVPVARPS